MHISIPQIPVKPKGIDMRDSDYVYNLITSASYGRLHLKHGDYNERHIFMNNLLTEIYSEHALARQSWTGGVEHTIEFNHYKILFLTESLVYWMRKNIDEMIGLNYFADHFTNTGTEPDKLRIASIGNLLHSPNHNLYAVFSQYLSRLERLNGVSNTYKHSFINSESHDLIGHDEPNVNCLDLGWNDSRNPPTFHSYTLAEIVEDYTTFFIASRDNLKNFQWR